MTEVESGAELRAARRVNTFTGAMWHLVTFVIINGFLWFIDSLQGGIDWAYWVSVSWGIGLAFHLAYLFIGDTGTRNRRYQKYLTEEVAREKIDA